MFQKQVHPFLEFEIELPYNLFYFFLYNYVLPKKEEDITQLLDSLGGVEMIYIFGFCLL